MLAEPRTSDGRDSAARHYRQLSLCEAFAWRGAIGRSDRISCPMRPSAIRSQPDDRNFEAAWECWGAERRRRCDQERLANGLHGKKTSCNHRHTLCCIAANNNSGSARAEHPGALRTQC